MDPNKTNQNPSPQNQPYNHTIDPNNPIDPHGVGLQSPIITPNQFDGLKPVPKPAEPVAKPTSPKKELTPEQMTKRFMILSIVLGLLAIVGIGLGIYGLIDASNTRDDLNTATKNLNNMTAIVNKIGEDTGKTIRTVADVPDYVALPGYLYLPEWNIKIKLDSRLSDLSFTLDEKYRPEICFAGHESNLSYFPAFADIDKNPTGMGCLVRVKTSEGERDENGLSFGTVVYTYGEYSYFYRRDANFVFSDNDTERGLEATAVELIKNMLTIPGNVEHYEYGGIMCTAVRFINDKGEMYFGRNLDWSTSYGEKVVITPKNYQYHSAFLGEMSPKAAIIGMAVIEENTPLYFDCANEAGLAIASLNFPGYAEYEKDAVPGKINVAVYEFPLWIAMNFTTVAEVKTALKNVAIVAKPIDEKYPVSLLHWMIGDKNQSIVVEYTSEGLQVFDNDVDVLTNQPGYNWHRENLRNYMNLSSAQPEKVEWGKAEVSAFGSGSMMHGLPGDYYPSSRFVRAAYLNTHYPVKSTEDENVSRLFHTLASVAMIDGAAAMANGDFEKTIYTGGFSTATNSYYYSTYEDPAIKQAKLSDYDTYSKILLVVL